MSDPKKGAILLVEDDPTLRGVVAEWLREDGFSVFEAGDGAAAIAAVEAHRPPPDSLCLVILDMMLPVADGVQRRDALARWGHYVPVLAVSADRWQLRRAADAGPTRRCPSRSTCSGFWLWWSATAPGDAGLPAARSRARADRVMAGDS